MVIFERASLYYVSPKGIGEETGEMRLLNALNSFKAQNKRAYILVGLLDKLSCPCDLDVVCFVLTKLGVILNDVELFDDGQAEVQFEGLREFINIICEVIQAFLAVVPVKNHAQKNCSMYFTELKKKKQLKYVRLTYAIHKFKEGGVGAAHVRTLLRLAFCYQIVEGIPLTGSSLNLLLRTQPSLDSDKSWINRLSDESCWPEIVEAFKYIDGKGEYSKIDKAFYEFLSKKGTYKFDIESFDLSIKDEYLHSYMPLNKRMLLPYRKGNNLQSTDEALKGWLRRKESGKKQTDTANALNIFLILFSGKKQSYVDTLIITLDILDGYPGGFICLSTGRWYKKSLQLPRSINPVSGSGLLLPHKKQFYLELPESLIKLLKKGLKHTKQTCLSFSKLKAYLLSGEALDWPCNENGTKIRESQIRKVVFNAITNNSDPHFSSLVLSSLEHVEASELYYFSVEQSAVSELYSQSLSDLGYEVPESVDDENHYVVGSKVALDFDAFATELTGHISTLGIDLQNRLDSPHFVQSDFIKSHNSLTAYLTLMMLANSTHRDTNPYTFCYQTMSKDFFLVKDKEKRLSSSIRVVPKTQLVKDQLEAYFTFCKYVASALKGKSLVVIKDHLKEISLNKPTILPTFGFIDENFDWIPVKHELIFKYLRWPINLPKNLFRHALSAYLRKVGEGELSRHLSGRISHSEHQLTQHSPLNLSSAMGGNVLDKFLQKLGFSLITNTYNVSKRAKPSLSGGPKKIYSPYKEQSARPLLRKDIFKRLKRMLSKLGVYTNTDSSDVLEEGSASWLEAKKVFQEVENEIPSVFLKSQDGDRAKKFLELIMVRYIEGKSSLSHERLDTSLNISDDLLYINQQVFAAKKAIISYITEQVKGGNANQDVLLLSFLVFVNRKLPLSKAFLSSFSGDWYYNDGVAWFYWADYRVKKRVVIDSFTLLIKSKININSKISVDELEHVNKVVKSILKLDKGVDDVFIRKMTSLAKLNELFTRNFEDQVPAYLRYYRSEMFDAKELAESAFYRLFFSIATKADGLGRLVSPNPEKNEIKDTLVKYKELSDSLKALSKQGGSFQVKKIQKEVVISWFGEEVKEVKLRSFYDSENYLTPTLKLLFEFAFYLPTTKGYGGRNKALISTINYLSQIGERLLKMAESDDIINYSTQEFVHFYSSILASVTTDSAVQVATRLRIFHQFLVEKFNAERTKWGLVKPHIKLSNRPNTSNIITYDEYRVIDGLLASDDCLNEVEIRCCRLMLIMGFRLGVRYDDLSGLKYSDFDIKNGVLSIMSNEVRRGKTPNINRYVCFDALLSDEELALIEAQWNFVEKAHDNGLFFRTKLEEKTFVKCNFSLDDMRKRVVEAMRCVTGDEGLSYHDLRGSFASSIFMLLIYSEDHPYGFEFLTKWFGNNLLDKSKKLRKDLTGSEKVSVKIIPALSQLLGHSTPSTTMESYIATFEYLLYFFNESQVCSLVPNNVLAELLGENVSTVTKYFNDTEQRGGRSLSIRRYIQKHPVDSFSNLIEPLLKTHDIEPTLPAKAISGEDYFVIFPKLIKNIVKVQNDYSEDNKLANALTTVLKRTEFDRASYPVLCESSKTHLNLKLEGRTYVEICSALNEMKAERIILLAEQWVDSFHKEFGLAKDCLPFKRKKNQIYSISNSYSEIKYFLRKLNVDVEEQEVIIEKNSIGVEVKLQRLKMKKRRKEISKDFQRKFHDILFLIAVARYADKPHHGLDNFIKTVLRR